jgi:hypothetical protein
MSSTVCARVFCFFALAGLPLLCLPARAEQKQDVQIGAGMICDTQHQIERLVTLLDQGPKQAIGKINAEENNPTACGFAIMAYREAAELATAHNKDGAFRIVQIMVIGVGTPQGFQPTAPTPFYSLVKVDGIEI